MYPVDGNLGTVGERELRARRWLPQELRGIVLEGRHVRLEPLRMDHAPELFRAGSDAEIWKFMPRAPFRTEEDAREMIAAALADAENGSSAPMAIIQKGLGRAVGSTRYLDIQPANHALEVGWTWLSADARRTAVNTECKYLLLRHAFEQMLVVRVQLKTDGRNERSQQAIERIGGVREGVLRRSRILWDGYIRDTVVYSILDSEWPAVKERLETMLGRRTESRLNFDV